MVPTTKQLGSNRASTDQRSTSLRGEAAQELREILDSKLFRALCEPVRVELAVYLTEAGPADVKTIAEQFPQHSTVISRHLGILADAGVLTRRKEGRHVYFAVDGAGMVTRMQGIVDRFRDIVPLCCPGDGLATDPLAGCSVLAEDPGH